MSQLIGWLVFFISSGWLFYTVSKQSGLITLARTTTLGLLYGGIFYLNLFVLIPRYFEVNRWGVFIVLNLLAISVVTALRLFLDAHVFHAGELFFPLQQNGRPLLAFSVLVSFIPILLAIVTYLPERNRKLQLQAMQLHTSRLEAETSMLKSQVNPHFLFNALNNIYMLAYTKSDVTADKLLQLSGLLRYLIYEGNAAQVPLYKEIQFLQDYINMQALKGDGGDGYGLDIHFSCSRPDSNTLVEPLLFIPLVENCFKHGNLLHSGSKGFLDITITEEPGRIRFACSNTIETDKSPGQVLDFVNTPLQGVGGVGLVNLTRRLDRAYKNRYKLDICTPPGLFSVTLTLMLHETKLPLSR